MPEKCFLCAERGRDQVAHYRDSRGLVCTWHRHGQPHPADLADERQREKLLEGKIKLTPPGEGVEMGARGTDPKKMQQILRDFRAGEKNIDKLAKKHGVSWPTARKAIQDGKKQTVARSALGKSNGGALPTLTATEELCSTIFGLLPLEIKAALLNKLPEVQ